MVLVPLEQGHQEIGSQIIISPLHVPNSNGQTQHLRHLDLDYGLHLIYFGHHVFIACQQGRELASLAQVWVQDTWDLLD